MKPVAVALALAFTLALPVLLPFARPDEQRLERRGFAPFSSAAWEQGWSAPRDAELNAPDRLLTHARAAIFGEGQIGPLLGCDDLGRCVLARLIAGLRVSLSCALVGGAMCLIIGVGVGVLAGWRGGKTDLVLMRAVDAADSVPTILVVVLVQALLRSLSGPLAAADAKTAAFFAVLGGATWFLCARLVRAKTLWLRSRPFIEAAHAGGLPARLMFTRHVLPNLRPTILASIALVVPRIVVLEAFLSFLGLGVESPAVSLGGLARTGLSSLSIVAIRWHIFVPPCVALAVVPFVLGLLTRVRGRAEAEARA